MRLIRQLWFQVIVGMLAGGLLGWLRPGLGADMKPLGDLFIALVRMIIAPVIFCTVVHGVAGMNDMRRVGRVALKALIYFEAVTTVALAMALAAVNLWRPGAGMNIDPRALDARSVAEYAVQAQHQTIAEYLLHIVPTTLVGAFAQPDVLPVLLVSVLTAFALIGMGERGRPVLGAIEAAAQVVFKIVGFVMWAAPIGAFGAIAFTVGKFGASSLAALGALATE